MHVRGLRALACARAHVSLSRTLIGLDSLGEVTSCADRLGQRSAQREQIYGAQIHVLLRRHGNRAAGAETPKLYKLSSISVAGC